MRSGLFCFGLALLILSCGLEIAREVLRPRLEAKIARGIRGNLIWRPDSPRAVQERYIGSESVPVAYSRFYLWNITNVGEVRSGGKPILEEVGPYTFAKVRRKLYVSFSPDNATVSFNEFVAYLPLPELTIGSLDDPITTLNVPLIGAIEAIQARSAGRFSRWLQVLAKLVEGWGDPHVQGVFTTRTAGELLFGYEDSLLEKATRWLPGVKIDPTFALVRNMTNFGDSGPKDRDAVATGAGKLHDLWQYRRWHSVDIVAWCPPYEEQVRGTDGTQFRPGLKKGDAVEAWVGEAFRAFTLIEGLGEGTGGVRVGRVPALRFRPDPAQRDPDPRFYQEVTGLMNVTAQRGGGGGPQLFLSLPGYCDANETLAAGVEGVECDRERHDIYLDIEPTTGMTLRALKTLMLSSWFGAKYAAIDPHVQDTFLPIFWAHESSQASPDQLAHFRPLMAAQATHRFLERDAVPVEIVAGAVGLVIWVAGLLAWPMRTLDEEEGGDAEASPLLNEGFAAAGPALPTEPDGEILLEGGQEP